MAFERELSSSVQILEPFLFEELQRTSIAESTMNFWKIFFPTPVHLIGILASWAMVKILHLQFEERIKDKQTRLSQLDFWILTTKTLMLRLRKNVAYMDKMEDNVRVEILKEAHSIKERLKKENEFCSLLRKDKIQIKKVMKNGDKLYDGLQKYINSIKKKLTANERLSAKLLREMLAFKEKLPEAEVNKEKISKSILLTGSEGL
jgi:hypothetical protein